MAYIFLGLVSGLYAAWLNTPTGRKFAHSRTAESTVLGTSIVLFFCLFLLPVHLWRRVALAFAVAGLPMVARSYYNRIMNQEADPIL